MKFYTRKILVYLNYAVEIPAFMCDVYNCLQQQMRWFYIYPQTKVRIGIQNVHVYHCTKLKTEVVACIISYIHKVGAHGHLAITSLHICIIKPWPNDTRFVCMAKFGLVGKRCKISSATFVCVIKK